MRTPVIKVARGGKDIRTSLPKELTIDSTRNQFKVLEKGSVTFNLNAANSYTYEKTITHTLPFSPTVIAFVSAIDRDTGSVASSRYNSLPSYDVPDGGSYNPLTGVIIPSSGEIKIRVMETYILPAYGGGTYYDLESVVLTYIIFVDKNFST